MNKTDWKKIGLAAVAAFHLAGIIEMFSKPFPAKSDFHSDKLIIYTDTSLKDSVVFPNKSK